MKTIENFKKIIKYFRYVKIKLFILFVTYTFSIVLELLNPYFMGRIIDSLAIQNVDTVFFYLIILTFLSVFSYPI